MEGHRLITARFTDNAKRVVEALWAPIDQDNSDVVATICIAEESDALWQQLLSHITIDEIHENTALYIRQFQAEMLDVVSQIAKREGWVYNIDLYHSEIYKAIVNVLSIDFDAEKHKEQLFMLKLQLFEQDFVKNNTNKELKKKLRKAATILEAMKVAIEIRETSLVVSSAQTSD